MRNKVIGFHRIIILVGVLYGAHAAAQCAPGVPSAGNPGCIPPNQINSPYYQGTVDQPAAAPKAIWEDRWGAIAVDPKAGAAGAKTGLASRQKANDAAIAACEGRGGMACEVILTFHNQCAAAAQRPGGTGVLGSAGGVTKEEAASRAIDSCGDRSACRVIYNECSFAERVQ